MRIAVLVKEVPDTYGDRKLELETGLADRGASDAVLDEIGERAGEAALSFADANAGTEVVVISMVPDSATATVRKSLAMGAGSALMVVDEGLRGADLGLTAEVLAGAVRRAGVDLVIAGNQSTDGSGGVLPAMLGELLELPTLTGLNALTIEEGAVSGTRAVDGGVMTVSSSLPAVVSITEALPDGRFPNFKGIMAAKKKPLEQVSLADLGIDPMDPAASRSIMIEATEKPPREAGVKITDDGTAAEQLADFLVQNRLA